MTIYTPAVPGPSVTFYGVRGSTPFAAQSHIGFGGNTCSVVLDIPGEAPILFDLGTGLFAYARRLEDCALEATVLLTHLHWDHVAGLPFFGPVLCPGGSLDIYGPPDAGMTLDQAINRLIQPPYFPVTIADLHGSLRMHDLWCDELEVSGAKIWARPVPHTDRDKWLSRTGWRQDGRLHPRSPAAARRSDQGCPLGARTL